MIELANELKQWAEMLAVRKAAHDIASAEVVAAKIAEIETANQVAYVESRVEAVKAKIKLMTA